MRFTENGTENGNKNDKTKTKEEKKEEEEEIEIEEIKEEQEGEEEGEGKEKETNLDEITAAENEEEVPNNNNSSSSIARKDSIQVNMNRRPTRKRIQFEIVDEPPNQTNQVEEEETVVAPSNIINNRISSILIFLFRISGIQI